MWKYLLNAIFKKFRVHVINEYILWDALGIEGLGFYLDSYFLNKTLSPYLMDTDTGRFSGVLGDLYYLPEIVTMIVTAAD